MPDRDRKRVPDQRSDVLKGSFPGVLLPILRTRIAEYPRLSEENEESRDKSTQRSIEELYQRQCGSG